MNKYKTIADIIGNSFINNMELMEDYLALTPAEFINEYPYISTEEYRNTCIADDFLRGRKQEFEAIAEANKSRKPITDITIRIEVDSDSYDDYEKCLDDFCNSLNECYIYRIDIREKQRED